MTALLAEAKKAKRRATGGEDGELDGTKQEEEEERADEQEEEEEDSNHPKNPDCHAQNRLLDEFFGSEEEATENLERLEKDVLAKINKATSDKDLKRIKSTIMAKQSVLLYAFSLVEIMRFTETYRGLIKSEEESVEEGSIDTKIDEIFESKRKEVQLMISESIPTNLRRTRVNKPEPMFTWNTQTLESWDEEAEVALFRPQEADILETDV